MTRIKADYADKTGQSFFFCPIHVDRSVIRVHRSIRRMHLNAGDADQSELRG
jgi:hypothetical protein